MEIKTFQTDLLSWYSANCRDLPWRHNHDPYRIWLSEVMLQQTQVATVIDYFHRFTAAFPDINALAAASEDEVFKLWEGLGYYSRARNLMKCARAVVTQYEGQFPNDLKAMLKLPGIGPYTAGAVLSIAFNTPVPAVDGNVLRVISRLTASYADIADPKTRPLIEAKVIELLPEDARHFNQALMELGATLCTPKQPNCHQCPVAKHCEAKALNIVSELPVKVQKLKKTQHTTAVAYVTYQDQVLLMKRSGEGLLSGLWGFPLVELPVEATKDEQIRALHDWLEEHMGLRASLKSEVPISQAKHVFTHKTWHMTLWHFEAPEQVVTDMPEVAWTPRGNFMDYAISTAMLKLIKDNAAGHRAP